MPHATGKGKAKGEAAAGGFDAALIAAEATARLRRFVQGQETREDVAALERRPRDEAAEPVQVLSPLFWIVL